jgi:hypothetical protein
MPQLSEKSIPPIWYCSDSAVQRFVEHDLADWNPYRPVMTAEQLFEAARARYGDMACWDLLIRQH